MSWLLRVSLLLTLLAVAVVPAVGQGPPTYTVQPGDTLSAIAARFGTTVGALAQANGLADVNRIAVGQRLVLGPSAAAVAAPAPAQPDARPAEPETAVERAGMAAIANLRARSYGGGQLETLRVLEDNAAFTRYLIRYPSDGLRIQGFMNVPKRIAPPFPVVIVAHGYVSPSSYPLISYTATYADALARSGYLTVHPNYRNHSGSDRGPNPFRAGYAVDVLNLVAILRADERVRPDSIGILGHSMGGGVALKALVVSRDIRAAVLYGSMSGDEADNYRAIAGWTGGRGSLDMAPNPTTARELYRVVSPIYYLDAIRAPVQIHHGTADATVPLAWSVRLDRLLREQGKAVELFQYASAPHTFPPGSIAYQTFLKRVIDFFDTHLPWQ